jgi:hypothetical protein
LDKCVYGRGVGNAVVALETRAAAPEEVFVGGEDDYAHEVVLHGLVGEVEERLAAVAVEEYIQACCSGGVCCCGGAGYF